VTAVLIDRKGIIRDVHVGEEDYQRMEKPIERLMAEPVVP
jgi:hypothetical protein